MFSHLQVLLRNLPIRSFLSEASVSGSVGGLAPLSLSEPRSGTVLFRDWPEE